MDLEPIKGQTVRNAARMREATVGLQQVASEYNDVIAIHGYDYLSASASDADGLRDLIEQGRDAWLQASTSYEFSEGMIADLSSLAFYDVWIEAWPSGAEDPQEAIDWQIETADGRVLDRPGNLFHYLSEPLLWGTEVRFIGPRVDGNGVVDPVDDARPYTRVLLAVAEAMDGATVEMGKVVDGFSPDRRDVFTALVVMVRTMNEYFEGWKESAYVADADSRPGSFIVVSRLFDINGILTGLNSACRNVTPLVTAEHVELDQRIVDGLDELLGYVGDLHAQGRGGRSYIAQEADLFGAEAQELVTTPSAQLATTAEQLDIAFTLEER